MQLFQRKATKSEVISSEKLRSAPPFLNAIQGMVPRVFEFYQGGERSWMPKMLFILPSFLSLLFLISLYSNSPFSTSTRDSLDSHQSSQGSQNARKFSFRVSNGSLDTVVYPSSVEMVTVLLLDFIQKMQTMFDSTVVVKK
jgi:hypothetical protein